MALTPEQEAKVLQIITAFDNGKRLNELPEANSTNPFDLISEVLDVDGETKQTRLANFMPYLETNTMYGVEFDTTVSSPTCTRIGSNSLHASLPIQNRMRGCLLNDAGQVVEYLNPTNWSAHDLTGARGQVMVEIPTYYVKFETDGNKRRVKMSEYPLPGYIQVKKKYISAYEAALDRVNSKLASVVSTSADYRGGNNNAAYDGTYRSFIGKPATSLTRTNFRTYARARKAGSTEWNQLTYTMHKDLYWLFVVEYATLNSQATYNAALDGSGYKQGGLGVGVTNIDVTKWSNLNGYNPFIPCGWTNTLNNLTGQVAFTMPFQYDANGEANYLGEYSPLTAYLLNQFVSVGSSLYKNIQACTGIDPSNATYWTLQTRTVTNVNRYRGVELPFGHLWKWSDGINIEIKSDADGGTSKIYVAENPANFSDSVYTGHEQRGLEARTNGWMTRATFGIKGDFIPEAVGGGDSTYFCDYHYTDIPANGTVLRGVLLGGDAPNGSSAGFVYAYSDYAPSTSFAFIGSRLCFIPA